jgi:hypothetical protein
VWPTTAAVSEERERDRVRRKGEMVALYKVGQFFDREEQKLKSSM